MARMRRGSVPVEYVLVVAGVAMIGMLGVVVPRGLGDLMMGSAAQMEVSGAATDGDLSPFGAPAGNTPRTPAEDVVVSPFDAPAASGSWSDDPWAAPAPEGTEVPPAAGPGADAPPASESEPTEAGCNQGKGNGAEGCDPGNSNQGDSTRSNDEPGGTTRNRGR